MKRKYNTKEDPGLASVEVWADYLTQKLGVLIEKDITEACLAIDLPKALALILMERLESGGQRFLGWEVQGLVTIFLYTDPDEVHEDIADEIKLELFLAMQEVPGDWAKEQISRRGSAKHEIRTDTGALWKEADATFTHIQKAQITPHVPTHADVVFEVAVKNESSVRCLDEALWWTHNGTASVCVVLKVYMGDMQDGHWLKPYITAFLTSSEDSGKVMRGPVELGAHSACVGKGSPDCTLNISSEVFTRGTEDTLPPRVFKLDLFNCISPLFKALLLDHDPTTAQPPQRPNPLSETVLRDFAKENGYSFNPPQTRSRMAWFS